MTTFTIGQRVRFIQDNLSPAVARIILPAEYGTVTNYRGRLEAGNDMAYMVKPDGEDYSVYIYKHEIEAVQP